MYTQNHASNINPRHNYLNEVLIAMSECHSLADTIFEVSNTYSFTEVEEQNLRDVVASYFENKLN